MPIRAVAFDLDGTLLDTTGLIVDSFVHVFESHGLGPLPREHWERGMGLPLVEALRPHARDDAHAELLVAAYRAYNLAHHDARVNAYPGVPELVAELGARGLPLAVISNKLRATVDRGLRITALAPSFTIVLGLDDVVRAKPDPEAVLRVAAELHIEPAELAMVGEIG
ncbi:MAG: HAD hydrolase-like protein, partial [Deltaproteobacteria bacterium]|nr:HAD hydrolase-like protein [Nannocystaceae bacterium]